MTQGAALYSFFNSFGIPAYPTTAIPKDPVLPYLTYQPAFGYFGDSSSITVQLWMRTESEAEINRKEQEILSVLSFGGVNVHCDGGTLTIKSGSPPTNAVPVQDENTLKNRTLNVEVQHNVTR